MSTAWYAVRVRSNFEHTCARYLEGNGFEVFSPTYRDQRQWSDRSKQIHVPLFSGYVFCNLSLNQRFGVLQAPGVVNIVSFGKTYVPVPDEEIAAVQRIVSSPGFARPRPYLNVGDRVTIERGPLAGVEGILETFKDEYRLVVSVHLLQRSVAVQVSPDCVKPVSPNFRALVVAPELPRASV